MIDKDAKTRPLSVRAQLTIFALAFLVRIAFLISQIPDQRFIGSDSHLYIEIAKNLISGNGFALEHGPTAFVSPGYSLFLAACFEIFGDNLVWASVVQCVLAALTCVIIARIATVLFNSSVGIIAGFIAAFYYELILWASPQLLTEPLYIFCLAIGVYYLVRGLSWLSAQNRSIALAGVFFGLAGLVRPLALPVTISVSLFLLVFLAWSKRAGVIAKPLILLSACLVVMMPWGIRNSVTIGTFTLLSLEGGHVFWLGNNPEYDAFEHPDLTKFGGYTVMFTSFPPEVRQADNEVAANDAFREAAWRHIFDHPFTFIIRGLHKTWNMWRPTFSQSSWRNLAVSWTIYPLILFSALGTMLYCSVSKETASQRLAILILMWILITHLAIHFLITGEIRFRVPLWVVLIPFSALFFSTLLSTLKTRQRAGGFQHVLSEMAS